MKQFWRNITFADQPAQGAWWGLCLGWGGAYLWLTLFLWWLAVDSPEPQNCWPWPAVAAFLLLYSWWLILRFYFIEWTKHASGWWLLAIILSVSGGMIGVNSASPLIFGGWSAWVVTVLVLPLALSAVRRSWPMAAYALTSGICFCFAAWVVQLTARYFNYALVDLIDPWRACGVFDAWAIRFFGLQWLHWSQLAMLALLALAAGGWAFGCFLTAVSQVSPRQLYFKAVKVLLVAVASCYLVSWGLVLLAQQAYLQQKTLLAQSFGRPLTTEALAQAYFGGQAPDPAYWERLRQNSQPLVLSLEQAVGDHWQSPENVVYSPDFARKIAGVLEQHANELKELEQMVQAPLPKYPLAITGATLFSLTLSHIGECRTAADILLWQLRLAAERHDTATALRSLRGLQNLAGYFGREFCVVTAKWGFSLERQYCRGVEILLENNMLTVADLNLSLDNLRRTQDTLAGRRRLVLYGESILTLQLFEAATRYWRPLTAGSQKQVNDAGASDLRWVLPAEWYLYWHELAGLAVDYRRRNETAGLGDVPLRPQGPLGRYWSGCTYTFAYFKTQDAYLSTVIGLLEIVRYRLEHGIVPADMVLPPDPYTGKPLQYRIGEATVTMQQIPDNPKESFCLQKQLRFEVLQVWSAGLDYIYPRGNIRSLIRISEEKQP